MLRAGLYPWVNGSQIPSGCRTFRSDLSVSRRLEQNKGVDFCQFLGLACQSAGRILALSAKSHLADHFAKVRSSFQTGLELPLEFSMTTKRTPKETRLLEILIAILRRAGGKPK